MIFNELARTRFSCRTYEDRMVEEEKIVSVLEAGRLAPSACNNQPWYFVAVRESLQRQRLSDVYPREWFRSAPVVIVICGDHAVSWKRKDAKDHCDIDVAIAVDHMTLQAAELGLGTCWICAFDCVKCSDILGLPSSIEPIVLLPLGYPGQKTNPLRHGTERKALSSILHWDRYSVR